MNPNDQNPKLEGTKLQDYTPVDGPVTQLQVHDFASGYGDPVQPGATITAHYTGALAKDGIIFQSSFDMGRPITFSLNQVIPGWRDGVPGLKPGGIRRLTIPAAQAYGPASPAPNIPPNSDLVFDIELISVQ